ncbi:50S ribosomal protein L19 [candidate division WWE3 bacterium CG_4_9_14_3_um_filter_41_6]|uniref:50S ribosomal protein L19 n=1 Tax=candidate division WWE3 bacterium CG_4_10_14_0_2_um_filter_41_14 TaxID=1975072 RepID=A0A2M7TLP4_UNCKA|nr:MAG: 50S ribosomal protein L19 [candidate division WWE3 bacterium CG_4_10_14_0_2_um_filter_41_14]PJA37931.1 MAG: 50S ribosomal protein L19 [candidate division WWE3 bacterium CG_4_9_14_3_um_filter_41_6]
MQNLKNPEPRFDFNVGDTIIISTKISEGERTRTQNFEGVVISKRGAGTGKTFIVRRVGTDEIGVERIFPEFSPLVENVTVKRSGSPRRAKLYYLRDRKGKRANFVKESA